MVMMSSKPNGDEESSISLGDDTKTAPRMASVDDSVMLPEHFKPRDEDVICSWARQNHSHPGNERFRLLVESHALMYLRVKTKHEKSEVIAKIVEEVRQNSPGGGFIKQDYYSGRWYEIGDEKARDKVGHAIRKAAAELGKKQSRPVASKKIVHSVAQMAKRDKKNHDKLSREVDMTKSAVDPTPTFWNNAGPTLNFDMGQSNCTGSAVGIANSQTDKATTSFMTPSVDSTFRPPTSVFGASNYSALPMLPYGLELGHLRSFHGSNAGSLISSTMGRDGNINSNSDRAFFHESIQRQQLLMSAAQKQQEAFNSLLQSNAMNLLAQTMGSSQANRAVFPALNNMNTQRQVSAAAAFGRAYMALPTTRLGVEASFAAPSMPSEFDSLFPNSSAAAAATRLIDQPKRPAKEGGNSDGADQAPSPP